ncbi:acyl-CoA N-acyltransferase [Gloeophyllum trabeum ATCC 11539]|uniref:Acyl-CoA N-acyltransferase n=1 Tax=Gloeophyllum trabeum (strain ATCC 11539 / FP-39264 / Madison 617) TaxID=670483 RepID=S7RW63_GLOTA|nr:acyl-CoA N-acyltransferase [Gloeophyllum trabeum ATCC 11539]EPQ57529.1 acyl-CoA N-acyltransferase [Gloeophyllum trabeum ATCC 11539]
MSSATTPKTRLASKVSFASLTPNNLGTVRKLNSVLFPIKYSDKLYRDILAPELEDYCKLIYYNDVPVGIICSRLEPQPGGTAKLYLMTMGVLAPYRSLGLGSQGLEAILSAAAVSTKPKISHVYLHVQVSNTAAKRFYEKHGFTEVRVHEHYYKKIEPHDAWILEKAIVSLS